MTRPVAVALALTMLALAPAADAGSFRDRLKKDRGKEMLRAAQLRLNASARKQVAERSRGAHLARAPHLGTLVHRVQERVVPRGRPGRATAGARRRTRPPVPASRVSLGRALTIGRTYGLGRAAQAAIGAAGAGLGAPIRLLRPRWEAR